METLVSNIDLKETLKNELHQLENNGNETIKLLRQNAFESFEIIGFPTIKNEDWKYTNFSNVLKKQFNTSTQESLTKEEVNKLIYPSLAGNIIVFINGVYHKDFSIVKSVDADKLEIKHLSSFPESFIASHVGNSVAGKDGFSNINISNSNDPLVLRIPANKVVTEPVYVYYIENATQNIFTNQRLIIVAEQNSQVKLTEIYSKTGTEVAFSNAFTEVYLHADAHVEYYKIQPRTAETYHVGTTQVWHQAKSTFAGTTVTLGGTIIRNNFNIILNASHCESTIYGLYTTNEGELIDNHSMVDHAVPNCLSNELYKGVLNGKSTGVFNGKIFVRVDAQKTNAFQSNKSILMSSDAVMNTKPQLEIFADDVKCSHGATIGQLDEEPLFYLRSRGLSEDTARTMLINAFAQNIIEHIKIQPLQALMTELLEQSINEKA